MPLLKYFTLAVALSRVAAEGPCVDEPDATLPGGWDCARIAEYIAGSDVHSCSWAGPWLSVMVAPNLAEEAAQKCPLSCNECAPDDVDAVDDRVEDNAPAAGLAKDDPAYAPEAADAPTTEGEPDADPEAIAAAAAEELADAQKLIDELAAQEEGEGEDEDDHPAPCVDMAQVELAGGWSCERVAAYLANYDLLDCDAAAQNLAIMVDASLARQAKEYCPRTCGTCAATETPSDAAPEDEPAAPADEDAPVDAEPVEAAAAPEEAESIAYDCAAAASPKYVADGWCDPENNVAPCYDGGDCCASTYRAPRPKCVPSTDWRNGSASDSSPEGYAFESRIGHLAVDFGAVRRYTHRCDPNAKHACGDRAEFDCVDPRAAADEPPADEGEPVAETTPEQPAEGASEPSANEPSAEPEEPAAPTPEEAPTVCAPLLADAYGRCVPENCGTWDDGCNMCMVRDGLLACTKMFCEEDGRRPAACVAEVSNEAPEATTEEAPAAAEPTGEEEEPADAPAAEEAPAAEAAAAEEKPPCPPGVRDTVGEGNPNQGGWGHSCAWVGFNPESCTDDEAFRHCEATCRKCVPVDDATPAEDAAPADEAPAEPAVEPADEPAAATPEDEAAPEPASGAAAYDPGVAPCRDADASWFYGGKTKKTCAYIWEKLQEGEHPCKASNSNGALTALEACAKTCGTCDTAPAPEEEGPPAEEPNAAEETVAAPEEEPDAPAADPEPEPAAPADEGEPEPEPALCGGWAAIGECESNPGFMLVQCKTACELKKLEEQYGTEAPPGDDGTYAYAPGGGGGGDGDDWDDNGMFGYGAQDDNGYGYGAQGDDGYEYNDGPDDTDGATDSHFYDDGGAEAEEPAVAAPEPTEAEEPAEPEPTFEQPAVVAEAVAIDVTEDINYEAKWAPMEAVVAVFIFLTCAFSMTRLCRAKEDQYAPVTRAISEEDLVAPDVETGPTLEDKRRMLD